MGIFIDRVLGQGQTTGSVAVTIMSYTVPDGSKVTADLVCVGVDAGDGTNGVGGRVNGVFSGSGGVASLIGAVGNLLPIQASLPLATSNCTMDVSGSALRVRASGVVGKTINWTCFLTILGST